MVVSDGLSRACGFRSLRQGSRNGTKIEFGRLDERRCGLEGELEDWDMLEEERQLSTKLNRWRVMKKNLWEINRLEEMSWRHKSRAFWLNEGDKGKKIERGKDLWIHERR